MIRITPFVLALCLCSFSVSAFADIAMIENLLAEKEYDDAIQSVDKFIRQHPQQPQYLFLRARALAESGQTEAAIQQYKELIQVHPGLPEAYNNLASIYAKRGELQLAEQLLNQAMHTSDAFATVYKNLTALNAVKARKAYAKALKIPLGSDALKIKPLEKLQVAQAEQVLQQENQGLKALKEDTNPTLAYKAAADKADIKSKPVVVADENGAHKKAIIAFLGSWASAWSAQDVDAYLGFYHADYTPRGMSRVEWVEQRRQRLKRPKWIKLQLEGFRFERGPDKGWRVRVEQSYKTNSYSDLTRKEFILKSDNGQWSIIKERGLGFIKK